MKSPIADKCLFAYTPAENNPDGSGTPMLCFLMPEAAWDYMRGGMCHEFNLTNVGIPIQVVIGRCKDYAHGKQLLAMAGALTPKTADISDSDIDLHLGTKPTKQ
jgi:hypothetical protein